MDGVKLMHRNGTVPNPVSMGRSWPLSGLPRKIVLTVCATAIAGCGGGSSTPSGGPAAYTVGVTVNGLSGSGLVLALNGTDHLAVTAASTTLTFTTSLPLGSAYQVVMQSQPSSPAQLCTVTNAYGTIRTSTNVYVNCVNSGNTVGQSGSAMPARTIPLTEEIVAVGLDPSGNIYVAMAVEKPGPVSIVEFQGGVAGSGSPINTISGSAPPGNQDASGISLDAAGNLYVLEGETLLRFAAGVNGFGEPTSETWVSENVNSPLIANFTVN